MQKSALISALCLAFAACGGDGGEASGGQPSPGGGSPTPSQGNENVLPAEDAPFAMTEVARFQEPWAMTFLPDGRLLVTEKAGKLKLFSPSAGTSVEVGGVPDVAYGDQGGFGDIILGPGAGSGSTAPVYMSWAEAGEGSTKGAAVGRAELVLGDGDTPPEIRNLQVIWRQSPKVTGGGHFGHRLAFSPDGQYLFITSGERQQFDPAQDMSSNLGKVVRLRADGSVPPDNPFADRGGVAAQIWSLGHRNPLGLAFDAQGRLWEHEMGPKGGDEVNLIRRGLNYGWPIVSNGDHYSGEDIPDHDTRPEFEAPKVWWNPSISPAGMIIYSGDLFPQWKGSMFLGGLSGAVLIRVPLSGDSARKGDRWTMNMRIREVEQGPDGAIWMMEDGSPGKLFKLTPR